MASPVVLLPTDLTAAHAMIIAERAARMEAEATAARAQAVNTSTEALITHLKLEIEKLMRALYGHRSERKNRLLEQMELQLEELEAAATEDVGGRESRQPDRERQILPAQAAIPQTLPRASATRARGDPGAGMLPLLRLGETVEAGRGHHRNAGSGSAPLEGHPNGARKVLLPELRDDHAAAGAVPCHSARLCGTEPACDDPVREVRPTSAAEPAKRTLCA